jgi:ABC-type lipoprotein release transport system permease subunit
MRVGSLDLLKPGEFGTVLGADLARALGVLPGDKIAVIAPQGLVTPAGVIPRLKQFTVVGLFEAGITDADSALALVNLRERRCSTRWAKRWRRAPQLDDLFAARRGARILGAAAGLRHRLDAQPRQFLSRRRNREARCSDPGADHLVAAINIVSTWWSRSPTSRPTSRS